MSSEILPARRVLVTAGAAGIGLAIARAFLADGADVHVCDVDAAALDAARAELPGLGTSNIQIGDAAQMERLRAELEARFGGLDVLVNNAGIGGPRGAIETVSDDDWDAVLRVNVTGMFHAVRAFVPAMKAQRSGCILNISTTSVRTSLPNRTPYVVSKAAVNGLTRNLARELGPFNIRCNSISPGSIENERGRALMTDRAARLGLSYDEALQQRLGFISMRTRIEPEEVGATAVFLASHAARHVTGQDVSVCGNVEWEE
ncbi:MAG: short-chain dehydrogenase/reductase [Rhodospirillales bacterium]|jgi:NAD(P)-dependent dehydrogenase (short-subunit alcohol dehydrogenase family)|nr:short-chain dehydrogenase/reductase [Rhodospirillales bacterium]